MRHEMSTLLIATEDALLTAREGAEGWSTSVRLKGKDPLCLAVDAVDPRVVYCGTRGSGVLRSMDDGDSWIDSGDGIEPPHVTAIAVEESRGTSGAHPVYAGTEPSRIFRSVDGGRSWLPRPGLSDLPSASGWSYPPRPETHHVRCIAPAPSTPGRIHVGIEAGALIRTDDGGRTWRDRVPGGPRDAHRLTTHRSAPDRVYAAAGDGYFESRDAGDSWRRLDEGLDHGYVWGLAVHPADPDTVLVSAAESARRAHGRGAAESFIYQREAADGWRRVTEGLPDPAGTTRAALAPDSMAPGTFYAASNRGLFRSSDAGRAWRAIELEVPEGFAMGRVNDVVVLEP